MTGARVSRWSLAVLVLCSPLAGAGSARADVASDVYADMKSVIDDLVTAEIAEALVPRLACRAGRMEVAEPALGDQMSKEHRLVWPDKKAGKFYELAALRFYRATLQRMYERQFGVLKDAIVAETKDMAAYLVFDTVTTAVERPAAVSPSSKPLTEVLHLPNDAAQEESCETFVGREFQAGAFAAPTLSPLDARCNGSSSVACSLAFAVRDALRGQPADAQDHLLRVYARVFGEAIVAELRTLNARLGFIADQTLADKTQAVVEELTLLLRNVIQGKVDVEGLIGKVAAGDVGGPAGLARASFVTPAAGPTFVPGLGGDKSAVLGQVNQIIQRVMPGAPALTSASVDKLLGALTTLYRQWRLAASSGAIVDLAVAIDSTLGAAGAVVDFCAGSDSAACHAVTAVSRDIVRGRTLWPLIVAASHGNLGEVAHGTMALIFRTPRASCSEAPDGRTGSAACDTEIYRRFAETLVTYTVELAQDKTVSDAARAAFRTSASDVIRQVGNGGGFARRRWFGFLIPTLNLRASWNAAYVNESGNSLRYLASIDWIKYRFVLAFSERLYMGLHVSLIDPLAPLSELATRPNVGAEYHDQEKLAWNFVAPRLDFVLGVPTLSKHLAVGGGMSLRLTVPDLENMPAPGQIAVYRYQTLWGDDNPNDHWPRYIEFGFFVKYVI
jgi:hypothetical protein